MKQLQCCGGRGPNRCEASRAESRRDLLVWGDFEAIQASEGGGRHHVALRPTGDHLAPRQRIGGEFVVLRL